jgi:cardiolipin synthase A/B
VTTIMDSPLSAIDIAAFSEPCGAMRAKLALRDNFRFRRQIENSYLAALRVARTEVVIASAYFLPGIRFRRALLEASARGVRVTLILQSRVEIRLLRHATKALYGQLLAGGVRIVEYERSFLHAKVAVVDGWWATVGSSNIDPFSLLLAREANVVVRDSAFAGAVSSELQHLESAGGRVVDRGLWSRRGRTVRVIDWLAYGLVRGMTGLLGGSSDRW